MIKPFSLQTIHNRFGGELLVGNGCDQDSEIASISTDTRVINSGDLFVALCGNHYDAHDYLQEAIDKGAKALVVNQASREKLYKLPLEALAIWLVKDTTKALGQLALYQRDNFAGKLLAITGSCGKTTVKGMLKSIFVEQLGADKVFATVGNFNNHIGVPLSILAMEPRHQVAIIEMGASGPKEIEYLCAIAKPGIAMVNNVMPAHVEGFGSLDGIAAAKGEIYQGLQRADTAVINADCDYAALWLGQLASGDAAILQYSILQNSRENSAAQIRSRDIHRLKNGCYGFSLTDEASHQSVDIQLSVLGEHNIANALAAASCAQAADIGPETVKKGLEAFSGEPGRLQLLNYGQSFTLIDDSYNASPGSVKAAIDTLAAIGGQSVLVLGDMAELGDEADSLHSEIGAYAAENSIAALLATGEHSRQAVAAFGEGGRHFSCPAALLAQLTTILSPESVVLVKGSRSMRMEAVIDELKKSGEAADASLVR